MGRVRLDQRTVELSGHLCECGCGERTMVAPRTIGSRGVRKGDPRRFVFGHGLGEARARQAALLAPVFEARELVRVVRVPRRVPLAACSCGCGVLAPRGRRLIEGHRRRGVLRVDVRWVEQDCGFESLCWAWQLGRDRNGYGKVTVGGGRFKAHRVVYEELVGPIPTGRELHHRCEVKTCVNPAHLVPLTAEEHGRVHGPVFSVLFREAWETRHAAR